MLTKPSDGSGRQQLEGRRRAPYADLGIFGPSGELTSRLLGYQAHMLNSAGEFQRKLHQGPSSHQRWRRCWAVFRTAMVSCGYASHGSLLTYEQGVELLVQRFPGRWAALAPIEEIMRAEQWVRV